MAKRISINKKSKVDKTSALVDDCLLRFDMIVKWEVKDLCYWLDAVSPLSVVYVTAKLCIYLCLYYLFT